MNRLERIIDGCIWLFLPWVWYEGEVKIWKLTANKIEALWMKSDAELLRANTRIALNERVSAEQIRRLEMELADARVRIKQLNEAGTGLPGP